MSNLLTAALGSDDDSDEEDDDYNPTADKTAEREDLPQDAAAGRRGAATKRRRGAVGSAASMPRGGGGSEAEEGEAEEGEAAAASGEEEGEAEAEVDDSGPVAVAKRARVASMWAAINVRAAAKGSATARPPSASVNLAELCRSASSEAGRRAKAADPDAIWMRSLGMLKRPQPAARTKQPPPPGARPAADAAAGPPATTAGGSGSMGPPPAPRSDGDGGAAGPSCAAASGEKRAMAAAALAAARDATAAGSRVGKVVLTEYRRFAGKDVQMTVHVDKDSKEAQRAAAKASAPPVAASGGLDAMLAEMEKKKKVSVLDKTKADWGNYKAANTEVDEELEVYKKSGEQYLEKQDFLKRSELRQYEKERDSRLASDVRLRGRL